MGHRIGDWIKENKTKLVIGLVLWIILIIVLVLPFTVAMKVATSNGKQSIDYSLFTKTYGEAINPARSFPFIIEFNWLGYFFKNLLVITAIYDICFIIAVLKNKGNEYRNIEHGSSDWSEHGEQYQILSNKKGIILSKASVLFFTICSLLHY